jgi:hypothetical protein
MDVIFGGSCGSLLLVFPPPVFRFCQKGREEAVGVEVIQPGRICVKDRVYVTHIRLVLPERPRRRFLFVSSFYFPLASFAFFVTCLWRFPVVLLESAL